MPQDITTFRFKDAVDTNFDQERKVKDDALEDDPLQIVHSGNFFSSDLKVEEQPLIPEQKKQESNEQLDDDDRKKVEIHAKRLASDIVVVFNNEELFEALFGVLNLTGSYIRNLNNKAANAKELMWHNIKANLSSLNKKQRQKLCFAFYILKALNRELCKIHADKLYLNNIVHKNIETIVSLFPLNDAWFTQGVEASLIEESLREESLREVEPIVFYERTKISLKEAYISFKTTRDKIAFWVGLGITLLGGVGVGVGAYFGCTSLLLGASATIATGAIIAAGVPWAVIVAGIAIAALLYTFISQIGKTAGHEKLGKWLGRIMAFGALFAFVALPFMINFIPAFAVIATASLFSLSFITFLVNAVILREGTINTFTRWFRGETLKKDNGKEMSRIKKYIVFPINFAISAKVGFAMATLFLFMSNPFLQINILSVLGLFVCVGVFITYAAVLFETHQSCMRAPGGWRGALEKLFAPAIDTFQDYSPTGKKIAWGITAFLSIVVITGVVYLGMTQGVSIFELLGGNPFNVVAIIAKIVGGIMGAITAISLASFYINGLAKCIGKVVELFTNRSEVENKSMKGREIVYWENGSNFPPLEHTLLGAQEDEKKAEIHEESAGKESTKKQIIITHWKGDSWIIFFEKEGVMENIIAREGKGKENKISEGEEKNSSEHEEKKSSKGTEKKLFDAINDYDVERSNENKNTLIDLIEKSYISKNRRWVRDIAKGVAYHPLLVPLNALVNASFIPGGGITEISNDSVFVVTGTVTNGVNSASAGFAAGIQPKKTNEPDRSFTRHMARDGSHPFNRRSSAANDNVNKQEINPSLL